MLILFLTAGQAAQAQREQDSLALVSFYHATNGPNWTRNTNWLSGPLNTWYGVVLRNNRVDILSLYANNLDGVIPPEIGQLTALREIWVHFNKLRGEVPESLSDLAELEVLYINDNQLSGPMPASWGRFTKMIEFYVNNNRFTGTIPPELGDMTTTQLFNVSGNLLTGAIPPELGKLADLRRMCLWGNDLSGSIPVELTGLAKLRILQIDNAGLSGPLPPELATMVNLTEFRAHNNRLSGPLPDGLEALTALRTLNLNGNELTGTIPAAVFNLPALVSLQLADNRFDAVETATPRSGLTQINLRGNRLTFADLLPFVGKATVTTLYPQNAFGAERSDTLKTGEAFSITVASAHPNDTWTWTKDGEPIDGVSGPEFTIPTVRTDDAGVYGVEVRNPAAPGVVLRSADIRLVVDGTTDLDGGPETPDRTALLPAYPNPFNPSTTIAYRVSGAHGGTPLRLSVYDILGREVAVLVDGVMPAGAHAAVFDARNLASGVYVIRLMTAEGSASRTVSLVK